MNDPFGDIPKSDWLLDTDHFFIIRDGYPVTEGHLLIVSKEPYAEYRELPREVKLDLIQAIDQSVDHLTETLDPDGFNIGMNCGEAAGQTVFHFHCHMMPRRQGDVEDPRGGVRHAVVGEGYY